MELRANTNLNWYTAYTLPNFEKNVNKELTQKEVEAYLPLQKVYRQWSDRIKKLEAPLFPNYIFIRTNEQTRRYLLSIKGILKFVSFEGGPIVISDQEISTIKMLERENPKVETDLVVGSKVKMIRGPLAGVHGVLFSRKGKSRFGVRVEAIQQTISIEVPGAFLDKA